MKLCKECNQQEIYNRRWSLCSPCYQRLRREGKIPKMSARPPEQQSKHIQKKMLIDREFEFIRNFFSHSEWLRHPIVFYLDGNGLKYTPDFYDARRNVFIEVAGTRQAWDQRKPKFQLAAARFPKFKFEARTVTGEEIPMDGRVNWNGADGL